jgi:hypothetical protein
MDIPESEIDQLHAQLRSVRGELAQEVALLSSRWTINLGRYHVSYSFPAAALSAVYTAFNLACLAAGVVFIFLGGTIATLGIAMVVGALFAFGTWIAQVWIVTAQRETDAYDRAFADDRFAHLKDLGDEFTKLNNRVKNLRDAAGDRSSSQGTE